MTYICTYHNLGICQPPYGKHWALFLWMTRFWGSGASDRGAWGAGEEQLGAVGFLPLQVSLACVFASELGFLAKR